MEIVADMNVLYDAFLASMNGSSWKEEPQRFEIDFLSELTRLQNELLSKTYRTSKGSEFTLSERGKIRHIHGGRMRDRVVRHALCDNVLTPALAPYLIYDNGASQTGKGIDFARKNFEKDLHNYWLKHRSNDGWVGFVDFSKFYDNIQHEKTLELISGKIDDFSMWLLEDILSTFRVDVSYMDEIDYSRCMSERFDSVRYYETISDAEKTGEKFMPKSLDIGDQVSQNIGVFYPTRVDTYATVVRGYDMYGRYMDDLRMIHGSRGYIEETIEGIKEQAAELGLFVNERKTRVCHLSETFTYLQMRYFLTDSGKVVKRISPKSLTRERRRLKAYKRLLTEGIMPYESIEQAYKSWMGTYTKVMSKKQVSQIKQLYKELYGKEPRWKNCSTK